MISRFKQINKFITLVSQFQKFVTFKSGKCSQNVLQGLLLRSPLYKRDELPDIMVTTDETGHYHDRLFSSLSLCQERKAHPVHRYSAATSIMLHRNSCVELSRGGGPGVVVKWDVTCNQ